MGTLMFIAVVIALKRDTLELLRSDKGGLMLRIFAITFVAFWVGNLTLAGKVPESAATAIFGSILGYGFAVGAESRRRRTNRPEQPAPESEVATKESNKKR
jgi:phosphate/sulfate permease